MKSKALALVLILIFMINSIPALALESISDVIVDLNTITSIQGSGLIPSNEISRNEKFTAKWSGNRLNTDIHFKMINGLRNKWYFEFYVYSAYKSNMKFALALIADNPNTTAIDFYYAYIKVNWDGWKCVSLLLDEEFQKFGKPLAIDSVSDVKALTNFSGCEIVSGTQLYFDSFICTDMQNPDSQIQNNFNEKQFILADYSDKRNVIAAGFPASPNQVLSGDVSLQWSGEQLKKAPRITPQMNNFEDYGYINISVYSEKATNSDIRLVIYSNNDETSEDDYYVTKFTIDWENEWKTLSFALATAADGGAFDTKYTPTLKNIKVVTFWTVWSNIGPSSDTVLYVDKIWLSGDAYEVEQKQPYSIDSDYIISVKSNRDYSDIAALTKDRFAETTHPRVFTTQKAINNTMEKVYDDPFLNRSYKNILAKADAYVKTPVTEYGIGQVRRLDYTEGKAVGPLAVAYKLTGNEQYKERAINGALSIAQYPDFNPTHFLDAETFVLALAVVYDLLYDDMDESERRIIRNGIVKNGFEEIAKKYNSKSGYAYVNTNWNVSINSSMALAALTFCDEEGYEIFICHILKLEP